MRITENGKHADGGAVSLCGRFPHHLATPVNEQYTKLAHCSRVYYWYA